MVKLMNDYHRESASQVEYLDTIINSLRKKPTVKQKESYLKSNRNGSPYSYQQPVTEPYHYTDDPSDAGYDAVDPYYYDDQVNCDEDQKKKKKPWKYLSNKSKASVILGSIGFALGKLSLISFSSFLISDDTTTTSTTSTTSMTTPATTMTPTSTTTPVTTTTPTTTTTTTTTITTTTTVTSTTAILPRTCPLVVTSATGEYKTIRTPGTQEEQCLSIEAPIGSQIQFMCTQVSSSSGTFVTLYDQSGTSIIADPPVVGVTYTSADNPLLIKSLATSTSEDGVCCNWTAITPR